MFSAEDFLTSSQENVLDDKWNQLDPGEYTAQVGVDDKAIEVKTGEKDGKPWAQLIVQLEILDPSGEIEAKLGRKPKITTRFFLDLIQEGPNAGKLDQSKQKNVKLGQLLKATGTAAPGWKLTDPKGKQLKIMVAKVKNDMDPTTPRSEVVSMGTVG